MVPYNLSIYISPTSLINIVLVRSCINTFFSLIYVVSVITTELYNYFSIREVSLFIGADVPKEYSPHSDLTKWRLFIPPLYNMEHVYFL